MARRAARGAGRSRAGALHGLPPRRREPCCPCTSPTATKASRRDRSLSSMTRGSSAIWAPTSPRCATSWPRVGPEAALANHLVMGPAILARALERDRSPLRDQGARQRAGVHGQARPPLPALRARGTRLGDRRARRLAPHRREPVGRARGPRAAGAHPAGPPGRRRRHLRPARARGGRRRRDPPVRAPARRRGRDRRLRLLRARSAGGGRGAGAARTRAPTARGLRGQADRLQGHRPAAGRLAARPEPGPRSPARGRRLRRVAADRRAARRRPGRRRPGGRRGHRARGPGSRGRSARVRCATWRPSSAAAGASRRTTAPRQPWPAR